MQKILKILGLIFLVIVVIVAIVLSYGFYVGPKLDKSSKAYTDEIIPIIFSSWSPEEIISRAAPELLKDIDEEVLYDAFSEMSEKYGSLKEYESALGGSNMVITFSGKIVTAQYIVDVSFEKGDVEIKLELIQRDDEWQILGFFINFR